MNELIGIDESMPCVRQLRSRLVFPASVTVLVAVGLGSRLATRRERYGGQEKSLHSTGITIARGLPHAQIP